MKRALLITTILWGLIASASAKAQTCTAAPSCANLGYDITDVSICAGKLALKCPFGEAYACEKASCASLGYEDTADLCPGDYITCPHDSTKVKCLLDAAVGDLKFSWQTESHDGWLLCDGSSFDARQFPDLKTVLGSTNLPNYSGYFLKGATVSSTSSFKTAEEAGLPPIDLYIRTDSTSSGFNTDLFGSNGLTGSGSGSFDEYMIKEENTPPNGDWGRIVHLEKDPIYGKSTTVTPPNYSANIFIYAGKKNKSNADVVNLYPQGYLLYWDGTVTNEVEDAGIGPLGVIISSSTGNGYTEITYIDYALTSLKYDEAVEWCEDRSKNLASLAQLESLYNMNLTASVSSEISRPKNTCFWHGNSYRIVAGVSQYECNSFPSYGSGTSSTSQYTTNNTAHGFFCVKTIKLQSY